MRFVAVAACALALAVAPAASASLLGRGAPRGAASPARAAATTAQGLGGYQPLTPWLKPPVALPEPQPLDYPRLVEEGVRQASPWRIGSWYCEQLGCPGRYPLLTIWGEVPMFETADALQLAYPSAAHRALVVRFARASEGFWNRHIDGYAPYPKDDGRHVTAYFDDNGWLGIAFVEAFEATGQGRYLRDAQRAFQFGAAHGWDAAGGGGIWWNTDHPYHSGPALASNSLLGMLLYQADHRRGQLLDAQTYVDWANVNDVDDERGLYLEEPGSPDSVIDYVQAPLVYAQYLLCADGEGHGYCEQAGRVAATMAERDVNGSGFEFNYGPEYDTIYMQWMTAYGQATGQPYWLQLAQVNADAAAEHTADTQGLWLDSWWGGPIADPETHPGMFRTMAATTSLYAWLAYYTRADR